MIRNVKDNNKMQSPYTTEDSHLRMGRFYSNRLGQDKGAEHIGKARQSLGRALSQIADKLWS